MNTKLTLDNFCDVYDELFQAKREWIDLGLRLNVDKVSLDCIAREYHEAKTCLREMLTCVLKSSTFTREDICKALRHDTVKCHKVAEEIEKRFRPEEPSSNKCQKMSTSLSLLAACRSERPDIDEIRGYLYQNDCNINTREDDEFKWTPLMWCLENKHFEVAKLLLKHPVDIQDKKEWTPLVLASRAGDLEIVQGIVELGAEIDKPTNKLWTPLTWAAYEGYARVAEFLLKKGAQVDFPDENGWTPLIQASQEGHVDVVNVLLGHNASINHQTNTAWCALMAAAKNKHCEVVDALLKGGAEVDLVRDDGTTALQVACYFKGNSAVVNTLVKYKANVDHQNKDGLTALMIATLLGHVDMVQTLIERRADLNKPQPATKLTAIFFAVTTGNLNVFKELLYNGANTEITNGNVTAIAEEIGEKKIIEELDKYKALHAKQTDRDTTKVMPISQEAELIQSFMPVSQVIELIEGIMLASKSRLTNLRGGKGLPTLLASFHTESDFAVN